MPLNQAYFGAISFKKNIDKRFAQTIYSNQSKVIFSNHNFLIATGKNICDLKISQNNENLKLFWGRLYNDEHTFEFSRLKNIESTQGSFHFIQYDKTKKKISFSNDKYGMRRFLYCFKRDVFYFSNTLHGLLLLIKKLPSICEDSLLHYYNFGMTPNDKTLYYNINKLPPGSTLIFKDNKIKFNKYFNLYDLYNHIESKNLNETDLVKKINLGLLDSVKNRAGKNEHVGVSISGGVDSGFIAQKIIESGNSVTGYNLAYKDYYDEYERVDYFAKKLNIPLKKIIVDTDKIIDNYLQVNKCASEPVGFNNASMNLLFIKASKDGIRTLFDGDGSDRLFLGMNRYLLYKKAVALYKNLKKAKVLSFVKYFLSNSKKNEFKKLNILFNNWNNGICPYPERDFGTNLTYDHDYEEKIYEIAIRGHWENFLEHFGHRDFGLYFTYQAVQMCPEMFFHDPFEMQSNLGMCPVPAFFNDPLVSLAISIPTNLKIKNTITKYILRKSASVNISKEYWMLPKIGLDNSFEFIKNTKSGREWITIQRDKVTDSKEYQILKEILPRDSLDINKLVGFITWKENQLS